MNCLQKCSTVLSGATVMVMLIAAVADAAQYQKLSEVEAKETKAQGGRVENGFSSIGIDNRQNVAAYVERQVTGPIRVQPGFVTYSLSLPYFFAPGKAPKQIITPIDEVKSYFGLRIDDGKIAISQDRRTTTYQRPVFNDLVAGQPDNLSVYFSNIPGPVTTLYDRESIALTGSTVFIIGSRSGFLPVKPLEFGVLKVTNPDNSVNQRTTSLFDKNDPIFQKEGALVADYSAYDLRASANTVLLSRPINRTFQILEKNGSSAVRKIYQAPIGKTGDSKSCGFAVSQSNVVLCSAESQSAVSASRGNPHKILVRFGATGALRPIQLPNLSSFQTAQNPSISQETVIFELTAPTPNGQSQTAIYLSEKAAPAKRIIGTNDKLNGKTIRSVRLSDTGQSLANRAFVFVVTFTDDSIALYRGTL